MKKLIALVSTALLLLSVGQPPATAASDNQFSIPFENLLPATPGGQVGYMIYGGLSVQAGLPVIFTQHGICAQPEASCLSDTNFVNFLPAYFELCEKTSHSPCVNGIEAKTPEAAEWVKAKLIREISYEAPGQVGVGWDYQQSTGLPGSAKGPLLFQLPGINNSAGTDTYTLDARYELTSAVANGKPIDIKPGNLTLSIRPTSVQTSPFNHTPERHATNLGNGSFGLSGEPGGNPEKTYQAGNEMGVAKRFSSNDVQFRLSIQLPKSTVGWFHGRLANPDITIKSISDDQNQVVITGNPILVPITSVSMAYAKAQEIDPSLLNKYWPPEILDPIKGGQRNGLDEWNAWSGFDDLFNAWFKQLDQNAKGDVNYWMVNTLPAGRVSETCFKADSQLAGIITTNAMAYQAGPPAFADGQLKYEVAGVHNDASGIPFEGKYDLILRSDVARCLYGFSNAPISASVSVVDTKEGQVTATTTFNEKDGWIKFSAAGFGFSQKAINIKLTQASAGNRAKSISNWRVTVKKMPSSVLSQIQGFILGNVSFSSVKCIGYFNKSKDKSLALARAAQACAAAKQAGAGKIRTSYTAVMTPDKQLPATVRIEGR